MTEAEKRAVSSMNAGLNTMIRIQVQYLCTKTAPSPLGATRMLREELRAQPSHPQSSNRSANR